MTLQGPTMPGPGSVLLGRFRIESVLGEGGMGLVFGARRIPSDEPVAIKVLLPEASAHPEAVPRFINEAKATMKLVSPHVVKVFEAGTLDIGLPFIVMELLEGTDLAALLEKQGKFAIRDSVDYIIQACDAVAEAHALGIVHRDLKPSNLFRFERPGAPPFVKVLDFGISKVSNAQNQALTATGTFLGSPHYMPPEQLKSAKGVDARADQWALGVILYEFLAGQPPFDARAFGELFMKVLTAEFTPLRQLRPEVPEGLGQVVARCLRRPREERFNDLAELARALAPFASPEGAQAAQSVGQPRTAAPQPTPRRAPLMSTALMADRPVLPPEVQAALAKHASGVGSGNFPASTPAPSMSAPPQRPSIDPSQSGGVRPFDGQRISQPQPSPSFPGPTPRASQAVAPFAPPGPQAPNIAPSAPKRPSALVIGLAVGALVVALIGVVLGFLALTGKH